MMDVVLLLEDDDDLRDVLQQAFLMSGIRVVHALRRVEELIEVEGLARECDCAVLDVNLGPGVATGLDAYEWLRSAGYAGRVVFLTGHAAAYPQLRQLAREPNTFVIEKPASIPGLMALMQESPG